MNRTGIGLPERENKAGPNLAQMSQFIREMTGGKITPIQVAKFLAAFGLKQHK